MSRLGQAIGTQRERKRNFYYPTIDPRAIPPLRCFDAKSPRPTRFHFPVERGEAAQRGQLALL